MATYTRASFQARDARTIAGILKRLQNGPPIILAGVAYTPAALATLFQSGIDSANTVSAARGQLAAAIKADRALSKTIQNAWLGLRDIVRQMFNGDPEVLADFGYEPRKVSTPSPVTQVIAVEKRRATRAARHTMGKVQRLLVKGTVTAQQVGATVAAAVGPTTPTDAPRQDAPDRIEHANAPHKSVLLGSFTPADEPD